MSPSEIPQRRSGVDLPSSHATPDRVGQATAVEQSRAIAEVQAAVVVAQQAPRSVSAAVAAMTESCQQPALADRAFFRFPRAGGAVTGPSIHLARELARCWGNVQYGISELRRDDIARQSEMQAWAWDVQTNSRTATTFIVPHLRDTRDGVKPLTDMRDIYENNANNGARRVREMIFAILPTWYVEQAKALCQQTVVSGVENSAKPLAVQVAEAVNYFAAQWGISEARLVTKLVQPVDQWTPQTLAQLRVISGALANGETTIDEEFPRERVTADAVRADRAATPATPAQDAPAPGSATDAPTPAAAPATAAPAAQTQAAPDAEQMVNDRQLKRIATMFSTAGVKDRARILEWISAGLGRTITSRRELTAAEAIRVIQALEDRPPARDGDTSQQPAAPASAPVAGTPEEDAFPAEPDAASVEDPPEMPRGW